MATIFVKKGAGGEEDGTSWEDAYDEINDASPSATDELWVCEGTYTDTPVVMTSDAFIYGGFANTLTGTNGSVAGRTGTDISIIDAASSGRCVTPDDDGHMDGFTIENGSVTGDGGAMEGAHLDDVTIDNCIFDSNTATSEGGAISIWDGTGWEFSDCTISNNTSGGGGGGIQLESIAVNMTDCVFDTNTVTAGGNFDASSINFDSNASGDFLRIEVKNGVLSGSESQVFSKSTGTINFTDFSIHSSDGQGCYINAGGSLTWDGGSIYDNDVRGITCATNDTFKNLRIYGNGDGAFSYGGGIYLNNASGSAVVESCVIYDNWMRFGGGLAVGGSSNTPAISNCTLEGNTGISAAGGIYAGTGTTPVIRNCICWNNTGSAEITALSNVEYCNVEGGYSGTGNINSDPDFIGSGDDPYNIESTSPCIDAGDGDAAPTYDILSNPRVDDPDVTDTGTGTPDYTDIGAYEYQPVADDEQNAIFFGCNF